MKVPKILPRFWSTELWIWIVVQFGALSVYAGPHHSGVDCGRASHRIETPKGVAQALGALTMMADSSHMASYAQEWSQSELRLAHMLFYVNNRDCHSDEKHFLGCIEGLGALTSFRKGAGSEEVGRWVPVDVMNGNPGYFGEIIERKGEMVFAKVRLPSTPKSREEANRAVKTHLRKTQEVRRQILEWRKSHGSFEFDFNQIVVRDIAKIRNELQAGPMGAESYIAAIVINSALSQSIDPHTLITPQGVPSEAGKEEVFGVNASLFQVAEGVEMFPDRGGPADRAGLRAGDRVTRVNGQAIRGFSVDRARRLITGEEGSQVTLTVRRKGKKSFNVRVNRASLSEPTVAGELLEDERGSYSYLRLSAFQNEEETCADLEYVISDLEKGRLSNASGRGTILDLRGNPGGNVKVLLCLSEIFLGPGKTIYRSELLGTSETETGLTESRKLSERPLVILLDSHSASASEAFAGAMQDHFRGYVAGERSLGKGTVQVTLPLEISGVLIHQTQGRYFLPKGWSPQRVGVIPDFEVHSTPDQKSDEVEAVVVREDDLGPSVLSNPTEGLARRRALGRSVAFSGIKRCVEKTGIAKSVYEAKYPQMGPAPDYQVLYAMDVLNCVPY